MNWINLAWLGLGLGLGLGSYWLWRSILNTPLAPQQTPNVTDGQQLQQLKQLELAYRMATEMSQFKGGFLARTAHELRSPLNGIIGMHQLILSDLCDDPAEEREFIAQAHTAALKMVKILDGILDVARTQHGTNKLKIQPIELVKIFQAVHDLTYLPAQDRNLQLEILFPEPDIYVLADPDRLQQVLVHLVDAAILHISEGKITVSAHPASADYLHIWVDDQHSVSDRSEPIDRLQTNFTGAVIPSPGLNLLADQALLELMQGRLEVLSIAESDRLPNASHRLLTRIQCSVPLVVPELVDPEFAEA